MNLNILKDQREDIHRQIKELEKLQSLLLKYFPNPDHYLQDDILMGRVVHKIDKFKKELDMVELQINHIRRGAMQKSDFSYTDNPDTTVF